MVVARNSVLDARGRTKDWQKERKSFSQRSGPFESLIQVLEQQGFEDVPFAVVALDGDGRAQVHASRSVKDFVDEKLFASKFEEAHTLSLQQARALSSSSSSPERPTMGQTTRSLHLIEDELMQQQQPSLRATSRRLLRTARHRGRSSLVQDLSPFSVTSFPYPAPTSPSKEDRAESDAGDHKPIAKKEAMVSFRIDSEADVTAYLESRLKRLQQLAGKKIAKAWIKGICPKKQARFPYQNKRKEETGELPRIPGWWPQEDGVCRFIEPDHIRREERMKLCLHLLRLRPSPQQLKAWNDDTTEINKTHEHCGWTEFLRELAGPDLFDDLPKEAPNRVKLRQTLLAQMYAVAAMEEEFQKDERDGGELFFCQEDEEEEKRPTIAKRSRGTSMTSSVGDDSRQSSTSASCTRAKRARRDTEHALSQTEQSYECDPDMIEDQGIDQEPMSQWQVGCDPSAQKLDVAVNSAIPLPSSSEAQTPWVSVQAHPQHVQTSATTTEDGSFAWSNPTVSMSSRRRALRAQRQMLAEQFDGPVNTLPVKQEVQLPMQPPQERMRPFSSAGTNSWSNAMSPYCTPQITNAVVSNSYPVQIPPQDFATPQQHDYHQYTTMNLPSSHTYIAPTPLEGHMCLSLDCCAQTNSAIMHQAAPTSSDSYLLSSGPETFNVGMQQPNEMPHWQHQNIPERYIQPQNDTSGFFFAPDDTWG